MSKLRHLADQIAALDIKDNPAGYLERIILTHWKPGKKSMKLANVNENDFSKDFIADLIEKNKKRMEPVMSEEDQQLQKEYDEYCQERVERAKKSGSQSETIPAKFEEYFQRQYFLDTEEKFRGQNIWHRKLTYKEKSDDCDKVNEGKTESDFLLPENLSTEHLIALMTTAVRKGLKAICKLDVDYYTHASDCGDLIGAPSIYVGDTTYITGKVILK